MGRPAEPGWSTVATLDLEAALAAAGESLGTDRRDIQGMRLVELWTWSLSVPASATLLAESRVPDVSRASVRLEDDAVAFDDGEFYALHADPEAAHAHVLADEAALVAQLETDLREHLAPLIERVNAATQRPRSALVRAVGDRLASALVWVGQTTGREARAAALARAAGAEVRTVADQTVHVRAGCCLYYRIPGSVKCFGCPLLTDDDRRALIAGG